MDTNDATQIFASLSQPTRLDAFRLIMRHAPQGLAAGEVARQLGVPQNTMSSHLAILERAGLLAAERHGRSIIYRPLTGNVRAVTSFLVSECCGGHPEICQPLAAEFGRTMEEGADACC